MGEACVNHFFCQISRAIAGDSSGQRGGLSGMLVRVALGCPVLYASEKGFVIVKCRLVSSLLALLPKHPLQ